MAIPIPRQAWHAMEAHAVGCLPEEACGLLAFDTAGRLRMVYPTTNADRSSISYTVEPSEHVGALRHAEGRGWQLTGSFHSHPAGPARPSSTDLERALGGDWLHVILGMKDGSVRETRAFTIHDGRAIEEPLTIG